MLCDISLPEKDALDLLSVAHDSCPDLPVIMLSKLKGLDVAIDCIRRGAYDYIEKPIDLNKLLNSIRDSLQVKSQNRATKQSSGPEVNTGNKPAVAAGDDAQFQRAVRQRVQPSQSDAMVGTSKGMVHVKSLIDKVALSDARVLVLGANGTGKELVAKAIHEASPRAVNPLVYLNCAALPESVAESELFGHVKGAFTGAISNRSGKFEMADNGTLFLDEIGELSLALQAKLLRVLQYGDIQRVGDDRSLRVDVRVLAATNRDLREEVLAGRFRADLFHRLSVFPLSVPPLRERGDDVILLAGYFCEQCRLRLGLSRVVLSAGARNLLQHYNFPGNVRELEHAIHRAVVLSRATRSGDEVILEAQHFAFPEVTLPPPEAAAVPVVKQNLREATEAFQRETIRQALAQNHHNWAACARMLETDVANLHRLAKRLGLKD